MVTVSRLSRDRRLLGEHKRSNDEAVTNVYPIIVDSDLFVTANRMMDSVMIQKKKPAEKMEYVPEVVKKIFQLYDAGVGTGAIVKQIPSGWSTVNVLRVLRDKDVVEQRIIDNLTFERVNLKLSKNGVANRIRKDIKIAADDYITNLFPRILKCGCCNGNIAIHYNHVRAKYVICRNREEKKTCDAKSFQYIRIEENILKVVKNVDFQKLMNEGRADKSSILDSLRIELSSLREEEKLYQEKIAERKAAGKKASIAFMEGLTDVQDRIDELEDRLSHEQAESEIPAFDFNLSDVLEPTNVELRAKVRKELRLVLSSVKYILDDKRIFISLKYFNEVISHLIVINNKRFGGEVLQEISITEKNGERIYDIKELGKTVFRVVVTIDAYDMWTLSLSRNKTVEAVGQYLNLLKRENLDLVVNEDQIEWID